MYNYGGCNAVLVALIYRYYINSSTMPQGAEYDAIVEALQHTSMAEGTVFLQKKGYEDKVQQALLLRLSTTYLSL